MTTVTVILPVPTCNDVFDIPVGVTGTRLNEHTDDQGHLWQGWYWVDFQDWHPTPVLCAPDEITEGENE